MEPDLSEIDVPRVVRRRKGGPRISLAEALGADAPPAAPPAPEPAMIRLPSTSDVDMTPRPSAPAPAEHPEPVADAPVISVAADGESAITTSHAAQPGEAAVDSAAPHIDDDGSGPGSDEEDADPRRGMRAFMLAGITLVTLGVIAIVLVFSSALGGSTDDPGSDGGATTTRPATTAQPATTGQPEPTAVSPDITPTTVPLDAAPVTTPATVRGATVARDPADVSVPAQSGTGKRVVMEARRQRMWWIDGSEAMVRTALVSGMNGQPAPGVYRVDSKSADATGYDGARIPLLIRFAKSADGRTIGLSGIPLKGGVPVQSDDQLGQAVSDLGVRQSTADARFTWDFLQQGDTIVVVP